MTNFFDYDKDAPILIVFGQSNAHGHGTVMPPELRIMTPLKNVHGLSRLYNQKYDLMDITWSGYTSNCMNLGETNDHTYCLTTEFSRMWQDHIDCGNTMNLPDLYVIHISIGGQGIGEFEKSGNMWYPDREPVMKPGSISTVDISLYPLAVQILKLAMKNIRNIGKIPKIIGLHWNQWESEVYSGNELLTDAKKNYTRVFKGFKEAIDELYTVYLYKPLSEIYDNSKGLEHITSVFEGFVDSSSDFKMIDISESELWDDKTITKGIFTDDRVHYNAEAQMWFARYQYDILREAIFHL